METGGALELWLKIAGIAFGLWSVMLPLGIALVRGAVEKIAASQESFQNTLHEYMLSMERRVGMIEADHRVLAAKVESILVK